MTRFLCVPLLVVAAVAVAQEPKAGNHDFEGDKVGSVPKGWVVAKTGAGEGSVWKVVEDKTAPKGPKVVAQTAISPKAMFNLCVADATSFKDVEITVSFKAVDGGIDQGGGVLWRYKDANNYYVARMNPLEDNYRLYKVVDGKRSQLATKEELIVEQGKWHTLSITMKGDAITCSLDGKKHLEVKDTTFTAAGKVGLWTKADANTYFDDFQAKELK
jgi:hypothetical protein